MKLEDEFERILVKLTSSHGIGRVQIIGQSIFITDINTTIRMTQTIQKEGSNGSQIISKTH